MRSSGVPSRCSFVVVSLRFLLKGHLLVILRQGSLFNLRGYRSHFFSFFRGGGGNENISLR